MENDVKSEKMFTVRREQPAGQIRGDPPACGWGAQADRHRRPPVEPPLPTQGCGVWAAHPTGPAGGPLGITRA